MSGPFYALSLEAAGPILQDNVRVIELGSAWIIAVADGAGGAGRSEHAAEVVVQGIASLNGSSLDDEDQWTELLEEMDATIHRAGNWGETTAVVLAVTPLGIFGASVGDSEGWVVTADGFRSITAGQRRKPLLGSGAARPVGFHHPPTGGRLVVGTDGLFKYAPAWKIAQVAVESPLQVAPGALIDAVRLPNGRLQDDVGVVICEL